MPRLKWIIASPVLALLLAGGGTWTYINVLRGDAPARLTLEGTVGDHFPATTGTTATSAAGAAAAVPGTLDGTWVATTGSQAGYRVDEILFGQHVEAVGRTSNVDGAITVSGTRIESAPISIDLASVTSDDSRRDNQFRGRIMNVIQYPTATFMLTSPIDLGAIPADGATVTVPATGDLTFRGVKRSVTVPLTAKRSGATISVNGTIPVAFADYRIPDASFGPAEVEDHGEIEFLVTFTKSAGS